MMIESRCGILCSSCGYKEEMGCKGCVHIDKPFWGDGCPVKTCCETREHEHCGQCGDFPCELLKRRETAAGGLNSAGAGTREGKCYIHERK